MWWQLLQELEPKTSSCVVLFCINCIVPRISCNSWCVAFCGTVMSEYFLSVHSCRGSRAAAGTVLWLCEWLLVSSADSYNITSYDCCVKMHTIAKVRKTIVTGIKIIARPGEIIATYAKLAFFYFLFVFVLVQWECRLDEGTTPCIRRLLPGNNWSMLLRMVLEPFHPVANGW